MSEATGKAVYVAGAIDYDPEEHEGHAAHVLEGWAFRVNLHKRLEFYCPKCGNVDQSDEDDIFRRNMERLLGSPLALFRFDGTFTVGTPIELYLRMQHRPVGVALWVDPPLATGLFLKRFVHDGALLLTDQQEVEAWLRVASR